MDMSTLPILYMGTPSFAVPTLEAMLEAKWNVVGVVCQPDRPAGRGQKLTPPPVKELALAHGVPVYQPEKLRKNEDFLATLRAINPVLIVVVAYGNLLPQEVLDIPRFGCLNLHGSILPKYRGAAPIQWALIDGLTETGMTLMKMDLGMDTGDMLATATLSILPEDTSVTLAPKLANLGAQLAIEEIPRWVHGALKPQKQNDAEASMAPKLTKETGVLDFRRPARELHNLIRGVQPWPGATTTLMGQTIKVVGTQVVEDASGEPGSLLALTPQGWLVATGRGGLLLTHVQAPGKPPAAAADVARGWRGLETGVRLGEMTEAAGA